MLPLCVNKILCWEGAHKGNGTQRRISKGEKYNKIPLRSLRLSGKNSLVLPAFA
jgi:hypothetical protein